MWPSLDPNCPFAPKGEAFDKYKCYLKIISIWCKVRAQSRKLAQCLILAKKGHQKFHHAIFNLFPKCFASKTLHDFHKRGQRPIAEQIKGLDKGLKIRNFGSAWVQITFLAQEEAFWRNWQTLILPA